MRGMRGRTATGGHQSEQGEGGQPRVAFTTQNPAPTGICELDWHRFRRFQVAATIGIPAACASERA